VLDRELLETLSRLAEEGRVDAIRELLAGGRDTPILHVRMLGSLRFSAGKDDWRPGPPPKRGRDVLAYLAANADREIASSMLADALWNDGDADIAHRLHVAVSGARAFLRELLPGVDAIASTREGYRFHGDLRVRTDVARFLALYREGTLDAAREAVALGRGDFLPSETAEWAHPLRVRCASAYVGMRERLADAALADGDFDEALDHGLELLAAERAHEGGSRIVMRAFAAQGRRGRALAEYESLRAYLREHLGLEPTAETTALVRAITGTTATPLSRLS
jgi:DNA-binding SARP family transcriptional activator